MILVIRLIVRVLTKTITNNGNAAASGAESNFYDGSFYFDGTGDYIITTADTDEMVINTQDFTLEAWIWNDQTGAYQGILSDSSNRWRWRYIH